MISFTSKESHFAQSSDKPGEDTYGFESVGQTAKQSECLKVWQINIEADDRWPDCDSLNLLRSSQK